MDEIEQNGQKKKYGTGWHGGGRPRLTDEEKARRKAVREQAKKEEREEIQRIAEEEKRKAEEEKQRQYLGLEKNVDQSIQQTKADGFNSNLLKHSVKLGYLPPVDWYCKEAIRVRAKLYFDACIEDDVRPTVSALSLAFGVDRTTLFRYRNRERRNDIPKECLDEIEKAISIINAQMEGLMVSKKIDPVSGIFLMKNNFGYQDNQNYTFNVGQPVEVSAEKLIEEANALPDDIVEVQDEMP